MQNKIFAIIIFSFLSACSSGGGLDFGDSKPNTSIYDVDFLKSNLTIGKTTTQDVVRIYGEPSNKVVDSSGSESWSYQNNPNAYNPLKSGIVRALGTIQSHLPSTYAGNVADSEFNKANGGSGSTVIVANKVVGTEKQKNLRISFKNGVLKSYSLS